MAIYHVHAKIIKRSKDQSVVAKAAYNARASLINENTGDRKDYRKKGGLLFSKIFIAKNTPERLLKLSKDRQALWSAVEYVEKRKDAQLAREIEVALPVELSEKQREDLVTAFVLNNFIQKGMIADVCFHSPSHHKGDTRNYHAHILLTMREIGAEGFGKKVREWNSRRLLNEWRRDWAHQVNRFLELYGHHQRIDHRSFKEQGVDREPALHLGATATILERKGIKTVRGNKLRKIKKNNKEKAYWSQRQAEHKRKMALEKIERDIKHQRDLNDKDLRNLSPDDHNLLKTRGIDALLQQFHKDRQRSSGRSR